MDGLSRGSGTWLLYAVLSCFGFLLNGLGAVLAPLRRDLGVGRAQVAFYPALFAAGLLVVGVAGGPLVDRVGRTRALRGSITAMFAGALLLAAPARPATLAGALVLGLGGAVLIQLIPTLLAALHPHAPAAAVGEANGLASAASVLAPLAVAAGLAAGLGWRAGYLTVPLIALAVVAVPAWRVRLPDTAPPAPDTAEGARVPLFGRWVEVLLAVSVEFCMVFWAASALTDWYGASSGVAAAMASLFLVGMATGRSFAVPITRRLPDPRTLLLICTAVTAGGFTLFWIAPALWLAGVALIIIGLGVALLYPTTVSRVVAAWPDAPDRAAARAALASGMAIGGAPYLLAGLSDSIGLRTAYLIVPALLLALALRPLLTRTR